MSKTRWSAFLMKTLKQMDYTKIQYYGIDIIDNYVDLQINIVYFIEYNNVQNKI